MISAIHSITSTPAQKLGKEMAYRATGTLNKVLDKGSKNAQEVFNEILSNGASQKSKAKSNKFINGIKDGWDKVKDFSKNVWTKTKEFAKKSWEWVKEKFGKVKEFFAKHKEAKAPTKTEAK